MKIEKAIKRDHKIHQRKNGMRINGRSIFTIQEIEKKRTEERKRQQEEKERIRNGEDNL